MARSLWLPQAMPAQDPPDSLSFYPARWSTYPVSQAECAARAYQPMLTAVGGTDAYGFDVANARPNSRPHLVAYADHATAGTLTP